VLYILSLVFIGTLPFIICYLYIVSGVPCPRGDSFTLFLLPAPVVLSIRPCPHPPVLTLPFSILQPMGIFSLSFPFPCPFLFLVLFLMTRPRRRPFSMHPFSPERSDFISILPRDIVDVDDVDVVVVVVLFIVFFGLCGCPVILLVGLNCFALPRVISPLCDYVNFC
jgi:hypothetical protein